MRVCDAVGEYALELDVRGYAPRTVENTRNKLKAFSRFCEEFHGVVEVADVTPALLKTYSQSMLKRGCKGSYVNLALKNIKGFLVFCYEEYGEGFDAGKGGVRMVKEEAPRFAALSPKDVLYMIGMCKGSRFADFRDEALLTFLIETGVRIGEAVNLTPDCIYGDYVVIEHSKNGKSRVVPITPCLKRVMLRYERSCVGYFEYRRREPWYFLSTNGRKLTYGSVKYILEKRSKGLETDARISAHSFRHFYAHQQLKNGMDIWTLSRLLGHSKIATTTVYLRQMKDDDIVRMAKGKSVLLSL